MKNDNTENESLIKNQDGVQLVVIWGPGGTGKTYYTNTINNAIKVDSNQKFINDYNDEEVLIMYGLPRTSLLVEILNGDNIQKLYQKSAKNKVKKVILETNEDPEYWNNSYSWLRDRITEIVNFNIKY